MATPGPSLVPPVTVRCWGLGWCECELCVCEGILMEPSFDPTSWFFNMLHGCAGEAVPMAQ